MKEYQLQTSSSLCDLFARLGYVPSVYGSVKRVVRAHDFNFNTFHSHHSHSASRTQSLRKSLTSLLCFHDCLLVPKVSACYRISLTRRAQIAHAATELTLDDVSATAVTGQSFPAVNVKSAGSEWRPLLA